MDVNGTGSDVGGLVGSNGGNISNCSSTGSVIGRDPVGGLVGFNDSGNVTACYSTAIVSGDWTAVGVMVGFNEGMVADCYSRGNTLVGQNGWVVPQDKVYFGCPYPPSRVYRCYSTGAGGLITEPGSCSEVEDSFWDFETSGPARDTWGRGTGRTTAELQTAATFLEAGWDFVGETANGTEDIWWIDEGQDYPRLWWELRN